MSQKKKANKLLLQSYEEQIHTLQESRIPTPPTKTKFRDDKNKSLHSKALDENMEESFEEATVSFISRCLQEKKSGNTTERYVLPSLHTKFDRSNHQAVHISHSGPSSGCGHVGIVASSTKVEEFENLQSSA